MNMNVFSVILQYLSVGGGIFSNVVHHFVRRNAFVVLYSGYFSP